MKRIFPYRSKFFFKRPSLHLRRPSGWQFGLRTLLLVTAGVAAWFSFFVNRHDIAVFEARIKAVRPLAHELIVEDASKAAVVKLAELWNYDDRWEIYLPDGQYRLCIATRGIDVKGLAVASKSVPISAGKHQLALLQHKIRSNESANARRLKIEVDGETKLEVEETEEWFSGGSMGGGDFSQCSQVPPDKPIVLYRRRFSRNNGKVGWTTPAEPVEGILLWIERTQDLPQDNRKS